MQGGWMEDSPAEIGVRGRLDLRHLGDFPRRTARHADVVACGLGELMATADLFWVDAELLREDGQDSQADGVCGGGVAREEGLVVGDEARPRSAHLVVRHDHVVLADVEEFGRVWCLVLVDLRLADFLVAVRGQWADDRRYGMMARFFSPE